MNPAALLSLIRRSASRFADSPIEGGMASLAARISSPGEVDPFTKMRYLPGFEPMADDVVENLRARIRTPSESAAPEPSPDWQRSLFYNEPGSPQEMDFSTRLMGGRVEQGFDPAAAADSPFPGAREYVRNVPDPTPPPDRHGFDFEDYTEGAPALTIHGMRYGSRRTPVENEISALKALAESGEEGNQDAMTRMYELTQGAQRWEDVPSSEFGDELLQMKTAAPPAALSRFLAGVRRAEFGALPETRQAKLIHDGESRRTFAADNPTQGTANDPPSIALSESRRAIVPPNRVGAPRSPYPELLEALQKGAIRGSFVDALDPSWKVGGTASLRLNANTSTPVRIKSITPYDPNASSLERAKQLSLIGRGVQDLDNFGKGHIVEFDITDSAIVPKLTPEMEVGRVVPISRQNGTQHQMEIIDIKDLSDGRKKLLLRRVSGEDEGERTASAMLGLDSVSKENASDPEAVDMLKYMTPEVQKLFKNKLVYYDKDMKLPALFNKGSERDLAAGPIERTSANLDLSKAQGYGVYTKRGKTDTRSWHWSGTKAHPLDRTYRRWVLVQTPTKGHSVKPGSVGAEIIQIDDAGFVTRIIINKDGTHQLDTKVLDGGREVPNRRAVTSIFPKEIVERMRPYLNREKFGAAETSRAKYKADKTGNPAPRETGTEVAQPASDFDSMLAMLDKASKQEGKPVRVQFGEKTKTTPTEDPRVQRLGTQEYTAVEGAGRNATQERLRTSIVRRLGAQKKSADLKFEGDVDPRDAEIDSIIAKIDNGERLSGSDIALMEDFIPDALLTDFLDTRPRFIKAGATGPAKFSMTGKGPREMESNSQTQVGFEKTEIDDIGGKEGKPIYQKGLPVEAKSTFRGKPSKQGVIERKAPARTEAFNVVEKVTSDEVKKNPDVTYLITQDTPYGNAINISKVSDIRNAVKGKKDIVISRATLAKLEPEEVAAIRKAIKERFNKDEAPKPVGPPKKREPSKYEKEMSRIRAASAAKKETKTEKVGPSTGDEYEVQEMRKSRDKERISQTLAWLQSIREKR